MADPISGAVSSSSATSRYPVDEKFPINPLSAVDCESSVTSELSIGPPIEGVGPEAAMQFTQLLMLMFKHGGCGEVFSLLAVALSLE